MELVRKRALLINPPVYDVQYWAQWSQPHGLLKVGSYLKQQGYETRLIDCLYPDARGNVPKRILSVAEFCSMRETPYSEFRGRQSRLSPSQRLKFVFGTEPNRPSDERSRRTLRRELLALAGIAESATSSGRALVPSLLQDGVFAPDDVWITSIMTYWWESTVDVAVLCKEVFPLSRVRIGGIYPTLAPDHLRERLAARGLLFEIVLGCDLNLDDERDLIVRGEIPPASWLDLDLDLYYEPGVYNSRYYHGPGPDERGHETAVNDRRYFGPSYAILTTTRGCPFNCAYCAQRAYNLYDDQRVRRAVWTQSGRSTAVRTRGTAETLREIGDKFERYGIRQFAFYEDNFLVERDHFQSILEGIVHDPDLRGNVHLHAPEGIEVRLMDGSLAKLMRQAGFERVYLPLENINTKVVQSWNRAHSSVQMFERAVRNCVDAGFILRNMQVNAFILFGMPGEDIRDVVDSVIYASSRVGSVVPMLFTPVPGSALYEEFRDYLQDAKFDLHHLNGKLLPFLEFNRRRYPELTSQDYLDLEALMFRLNAQAVRGTFNVGGKGRVSTSFREIVCLSRSTPNGLVADTPEAGLQIPPKPSTLPPATRRALE
jgi:radical SAM superfamily enzyme YgiQ (UPF0313 family)